MFHVRRGDRMQGRVRMIQKVVCCETEEIYLHIPQRYL